MAIGKRRGRVSSSKSDCTETLVRHAVGGFGAYTANGCNGH